MSLLPLLFRPVNFIFFQFKRVSNAVTRTRCSSESNALCSCHFMVSYSSGSSRFFFAFFFFFLSSCCSRWGRLPCALVSLFLFSCTPSSSVIVLFICFLPCTVSPDAAHTRDKRYHKWFKLGKPCGTNSRRPDSEEGVFLPMCDLYEELWGVARPQPSCQGLKEVQ